MASMELLAPAGGREQLEYAILFGADAVYLACERYGMRSRAASFSLEELPSVVSYAHASGVKVHLTCNTAMRDADFAHLPAFFEAAEHALVDALIIGDMGAAAMSRRYAPDVKLHVSTQASVSNSEAAKMWHQLGASRIVAARELSLRDIAQLKSNMPAGMELEVFAHGAMCMGYSGRCMLSDFIQGTSGLYGNCSQPCRWQYSLMSGEVEGRYTTAVAEESSRLLNAEDLCMIEHLEDFRNVGVDSIKIEGRTKKAYYVACVVNAYRKVLDGVPSSVIKSELECVCHRPYSTGFYFGKGHQTEDLVYTRKTHWVAQALECEPRADGCWKIKLKCRNKFSPSDMLELLSPSQPVRRVHVMQLLYDPSSRMRVLSGKASSDWKPKSNKPVPVEVADHPAEDYFAVVDAPMRRNDIIRVVL